MQDCLKNVYTQDDDRTVFYQAFSSYFKKHLCTGELNEEIYNRDIDQLRENFDAYKMLKRSDIFT